MKKKIAALVMALAVAVSPMTVAAEWKQDSYQNWQWVENGTPVTGWKFIDQNWYYFGGNGKMVTGWQNIEGKWYYFNRNGAMQTGWSKVDGKWYYLNGSGEMVTGWKKVAGYWYYMNSQGVMQTGWLSYGNDKYYLAPKGDMQVGWVEVGEDRYFMNHDGVIQVGMIEVDGEVYYFGADGKMVTGKVKIGGKQYEFAKTGESVGKLTPKPGKAFDTSGFSTTITVEGGTSSSSGSTIVYVPVDNGNSGSTGENPGGTTDIPDDLTDQQERDRLDDYLEQQVALYGTDYYRDFTVSFDRSSHIVDITIQNPDKRIINMSGLGLNRMIGDYDDGKITRFSINGCAYHNLYVVQQRRRVYNTLAGYASEFQKTASDVDILDTLGALDGKTVKMTLRNEDMAYRSYTFRFTVNGDAEYADDVAYYMSTELRSDNGVYISNYKAKCEQRGNDIFVSLNDYDSLDYVVLSNFVYHNVYYNSLCWNTKAAIESGKVYAHSYSLYDTNCCSVKYAVKQTEGDTDTYIFYDRDGQEVMRCQIQNVESGILLLGMNLKDFNTTDKTQDTSQSIGEITCIVDPAVNPGPTPDPDPTPGETKVEYTLDGNASTDYTLDENGLTFGMPEGKEARFISTNLTFNEGVSVGDVKVTRVRFGDFVGTSQSTYLYTDHGSFYDAAYTEENGIRTYTFKNDTVEVPIRVRVSEDGTLTFPDFTTEKLQGQNVQMTATSRGRVIITDRNDSYEGKPTATWSFNEEGKLVIQALDGEHFRGELRLSFNTAYTLENASIGTLGICDIYDADNCVYVGVDKESYTGRLSLHMLSYTLNDDVMTFRVTIPSVSQSFAFSVKRSEDRKTVVLEDITRDSLLSNTITVWIPTIPDSTAYVHSESELEKACADSQVNKIYIADNFRVSKTLTIENRTIEMVGDGAPGVGSSSVAAASDEAKIVLIHSGTKENPTKLSRIDLPVIAKNSVIVGNKMSQSIELEGSTLDVYSIYGSSQFEVKMDLDKNVENTSTVTFYAKPNVKRVISGNENSQFVVASGIDASYTKTFDEGNGYWVWTLDQ